MLQRVPSTQYETEGANMFTQKGKRRPATIIVSRIQFLTIDHLCGVCVAV